MFFSHCISMYKDFDEMYFLSKNIVKINYWNVETANIEL